MSFILGRFVDYSLAVWMEDIETVMAFILGFCHSLPLARYYRHGIYQADQTGDCRTMLWMYLCRCGISCTIQTSLVKARSLLGISHVVPTRYSLTVRASLTSRILVFTRLHQLSIQAEEQVRPAVSLVFEGQSGRGDLRDIPILRNDRSYHVLTQLPCNCKWYMFRKLFQAAIEYS